MNTHEHSQPGGATAQAKAKAGEIREKAHEATSQAKESIGKTAADMKEKAAQTGAQMKEKGEAYLGEQKERAAGRVHGYSEAARETADRLRQEHDPNLAQYADTVADRLDHYSNYIRGQDWQGLASDLENTARRHPELVFGGLFLAGLSMGRFLRSSEKRRQEDRETPEEYPEEAATYEPAGSYVNPSVDPISASPIQSSVGTTPPTGYQPSEPGKTPEPVSSEKPSSTI